MRNVGLETVTRYIRSLGEILEQRVEGRTPFSLADIKIVCKEAVFLATGEQCDDNFSLRINHEEFSVQLQGFEGQTATIEGINRDGMLLVLRNLFANVWKHGKINGRACATLRLEKEDGIRIVCRNPLPRGQLSNDAFTRLIQPDGSMLALLQPFRSIASPSEIKEGKKRGDGLGLFTVNRIVQQSQKAIELIGPRLVPWRSEQPLFEVGLQTRLKE